MSADVPPALEPSAEKIAEVGREEEGENAEDDHEGVPWQSDLKIVTLTKDRKAAMLNKAIALKQACPTAQDLLKGYLEDDHRAYRRIMRLVLNRNPETKEVTASYSLRYFSVAEVHRLQQLGLNTASDDVVFGSGEAEAVTNLKPHESKLNAKEKKSIAKTIQGVNKKYAEAVEAERKKRVQRPVVMDMANGGQVTQMPNPPPTAEEIASMAAMEPTKRLD